MTAERVTVGSVVQVEVDVGVRGNQPGCVVTPIIRDGVAWYVRILLAAADAISGDYVLEKWLAGDGDQVRVALDPVPNWLAIFHLRRVRHEGNANVVHDGRIYNKG